MKEQEKKQSRVLLAPIVAYMLVGYGLLFSVYQIETLVSRLLSHCRLFRPFEFTATAWHEDTMWVNIAFPLTWPILTVRALLLVIVALSFASMERFFSHVNKVLEWLRHLVKDVVSIAWQALIQLAIVIRRGFVAVALVLRNWIWKLMSLVHMAFVSFWKYAATISRHLLYIITPVILSIKQVILSPFRWLWLGFILIGRTVRVWFLEFVKTVWREIVTAGMWLWIGLRYLGRQAVLAIQIGRRWIVLASVTVWQYLLVPLRWSRAALVEILRELLTILQFCWQWLMIGLQTIWGWLLLRLRWFWTGLIVIRQQIVIVAGLVWGQLRVGFRTTMRWLLVIIRQFWAQLRWLGSDLANFMAPDNRHIALDMALAVHRHVDDLALVTSASHPPMVKLAFHLETVVHRARQGLARIEYLGQVDMVFLCPDLATVGLVLSDDLAGHGEDGQKNRRLVSGLDVPVVGGDQLDLEEYHGTGNDGLAVV